MSRSILVSVGVAALLALASTAHADDTSSSPPPDEHVEVRIVNGRRHYVLPTEVLHGERQTPYVFAIPGRGPLGYTPAQTTHSDAARVVEAVRHAPF